MADVVENVKILEDCIKEMALQLEDLRNDNATLLEKSQTMIDFHQSQSAEIRKLL